MDRVRPVQHKELHDGRWAEMPFALQMANIGSEVSRAVRWKNKGNESRFQKAFCRALELVDLTISVVQHDVSIDGCSQSGRLRELCRAREEMCDFFTDAGFYDTDQDRMMRYYDQFALMS